DQRRVAVLEPLWTKTPETASRVRGRIERILDWARVRGFREGENPARWRGAEGVVGHGAPRCLHRCEQWCAVVVDKVTVLRAVRGGAGARCVARSSARPCYPSGRSRSGRSRHWVKSKNPRDPAVKREAEEDWAR